MVKFAKRLEPYTQYAFAELSKLRKEIEKKRLTIDMGVGDPDFPPPQEIQGALISGLTIKDSHRYPEYTGDNFLKESIARFFLNRYRVQLDPTGEILVLIGSKEGIFHLPLALLNPGDVGAYTEPGYPVYRAGIELAGGIATPIPLREENEFMPVIKEIPKEAKILFVNYPNNPTTATADISFWKKLVQWARDTDTIVVNDASYSEIYFGEPTKSILQIDEAKDVAVEFHSLSKTFSMTGWRIGFLVGNKDVISALSAVKQYADSGVFRAIQYAGKVALDNYWNLCDSIRRIYSQRVNIWRLSLSDVGIESYNYGATFYVWAKVPQNFSDDNEFAKFLLENTGIVCLPGSTLGPSGKGFVRFSLTLKDDDIKKAQNELQKIKPQIK